jgi:Arc/MetJ-type ribon-helix-helix transcriptional regulator
MPPAKPWWRFSAGRQRSVDPVVYTERRAIFLVLRQIPAFSPARWETPASEVVREALRLLEEYEQARAAQLDEFNKELGRRLSSLGRGEHVDPAEARSRLQRKSYERRRQRA